MSGDVLENAKILVVEDDQRMRSFLCAVFAVSANGVLEYAESTDGEEALKVLAKFKPDIIIADWIMEPMNGLELLKKIRLGFKDISPFIPFIMVTSRTDDFWKAQARDAGVTEYLEKPVSITDLNRAVERSLKDFRPFVRSPDYFGPDRRRRDGHYSGDDRRTTQPVYASPPMAIDPPGGTRQKWMGRAS